MLIQDDEKAHVIIGEAALRLALGEREISVASLLSELGLMAKAGGSPDRLAQIAEARRWLSSFSSPVGAWRKVPDLQTLAALNEKLN
ncbi:hypothetical protein [Erwinia sp. QL-Z3]|uniref:hypothetical protein n=1 Tax=Erwinia sp. QL-Z3 TaxID=2547962 RepID=UPI001071384B|nr:hypothetical protein [Erwinia sp. QL-Z3]QBR48570.1 hypothetical protein E2F51_00555 [Erwinia sp. QL-Z3]